MSEVWQQIFSLDAKYNAQRVSNCPNFRTLYIRRRNQLLRDAFQGEATPDQKFYLKLRAFLLQQRYGPLDQKSVRSRSMRSLSKVSDISDTRQELTPTKLAEASKALVGGTTIAENYAFNNVAHIFDQHQDAVVSVKFANNDKSRLLCASRDGKISICNVDSHPPCVELLLHEHTKSITSCDWSADNDLVVSSSLDGTIRLWDANSGKCLRVVQDLFGGEILCCLFQPTNNNMVITGNSKSVLSVVNISTGIYPKGGSCKLDEKILTLAVDLSGNLIWAGSKRGSITSCWYDTGSGRLSKLRRITVCPGKPITCLSWKAWVSHQARDPSLLVNCAADILCLYRVTDKNGSLLLKKKFTIPQKGEMTKSSFCPIMSFREGACVVTGSEDSCVYILDIVNENKPLVNKLQGHVSPVLGVSFNYDESFLATSDLQGLVIIWKRDNAKESSTFY